MKWLTSEEACDFLGIKLPTLNKLCCYKQVSYYKPGRARMFREEDLIEYVEKNRIEAVS